MLAIGVVVHLARASGNGRSPGRFCVGTGAVGPAGVSACGGADGRPCGHALGDSGIHCKVWTRAQQKWTRSCAIITGFRRAQIRRGAMCNSQLEPLMAVYPADEVARTLLPLAFSLSIHPIAAVRVASRASVWLLSSHVSHVVTTSLILLRESTRVGDADALVCGGDGAGGAQRYGQDGGMRRPGGVGQV